MEKNQWFVGEEKKMQNDVCQNLAKKNFFFLLGGCFGVGAGGNLELKD